MRCRMASILMQYLLIDVCGLDEIRSRVIGVRVVRENGVALDTEDDVESFEVLFPLYEWK